MITDELQAAITTAVRACYGLTDVEGVVQAANEGFGDFTSNVAFGLAKQLQRSPREIAQQLASAIAHPRLLHATAAGAGFLNLTLSDEHWLEVAASISPTYGANNTGEGKKLQVEFISANPTGPTTIGNARGGFIGDVLSRVLARSGYKVTREYYFNNAGTQISKLLESIKMEAGLLPETDERQYRGTYITDIAKLYHTQLTSLPDDQLKPLITTYILQQYIQPAMVAMGITFDVWFNEQDLLEDGSFELTMNALRERDLIFERDGATWLKTGELGDERPERVIIKSNGDPTYMAPDIAYHVNIFGKRGFDGAIKVLGPDHIAQFPSVYAAVHALHPDKEFKMASYQWLRLMQGGKEVKVSKRLGQFVTVIDLIEQVSLPVARFLMLMRSADSHMDFDLDLAREQSAKNPYFYVMYAYARAHSIVARAHTKGLEPATTLEVMDEVERRLIKQIARFPEVILEIAHDYGVHRLTFFGVELAKIFQEYYESTRIIDLPEHEAAQKLYVVQRFITFMDVYWNLMGIIPVTRMESELSDN